MRTEGQVDMTKLIVVFLYFADAPKNLFLVSGIEIRFLACPSRSLVTILTELFGPRRRLSSRYLADCTASFMQKGHVISAGCESS